MSDDLIRKFLPFVFSALALIVSLFSLLVSFLTYRFRVNKEKANAPSIDVLHLDSVKYLPDENETEKNHQWSFKVLISNLSGSKNSILNARMHFSFVDFDGISGNLFIPAELEGEQNVTLPIALEPYESQTAWFSFTLPERIYKKMREIDYVVEFEDIGKLGKTIEPKLVLTKNLTK